MERCASASTRDGFRIGSVAARTAFSTSRQGHGICGCGDSEWTGNKKGVGEMNKRSFLSTIGTAIPSILTRRFTAPKHAPESPPGYACLIGGHSGRTEVARLAMVDGDPMLDPYWLGEQTYKFTFEWLPLNEELHVHSFELKSADGVPLTRGAKKLTGWPWSGGPILIQSQKDVLYVTYERMDSRLTNRTK
jgi:hypothetical protein